MTHPTAAARDFSELGLRPALVQGAAAVGWVEPTRVQACAVPAILQGRDVLGVAPTGSGKTAAFLLPLLQRLLAESEATQKRPGPGAGSAGALVLAPTRELALQIGAAAQQLAPQLKTVLAIGGVSINPQMMALRGGAHLVVATPGRLLDLVDHNALRLGEVKAVVFDEVDRLLDLGFADEIGRVLALLPQQRQTLMFSATLPETVAALAAQLLHSALHVNVTAIDSDAPDIHQRAIEVDTQRRTPLLVHLNAREGWGRVMVFVATQYASEHVAEKLRRAGLPAAALHGQLSQGLRSRTLADFQSRAQAILVATDLASRGIDLPQLAAVVNHDLPRSAVDYTHRIGRTGRAGAAGVAISFICADAPGSEAHFRLIEKRQKQRVPRERVVGFEPKGETLPEEQVAGTGGVKGQRKSKKDKLREAAAR